MKNLQNLKLIYLFSMLLLANMNSYAQTQNTETTVIRATQFNTTRSLREIFANSNLNEDTLNERDKKEKHAMGDKKGRTLQQFPLAKNGDPIYGNDESTIQREEGRVEGSLNKVSWTGLNAGAPNDPSGAIGPNHYIQIINATTFRVYDKVSGTMLLTGTLGNLWTPATANNGDPIVMYDKAAGRWFMSQFGNKVDKKIYIAVSQTSDPLGSWYTYTYVSPEFPDYLKFGVWHDAYYMTAHIKPNNRVFAFNRAEILAGTVGARAISEYFPTPGIAGFFCPLPADAADGILPPAGTPCPISYYNDNGWGALYNDAISMWNMSVNWVPLIPTVSITLAADIPTAAFNSNYDNVGVPWEDCPQPGTSQKLDGIGGVFMYRAQWKKWAGYNTLVLNWAVEISSTQRGIKWCELRQTGGTWSMYQEGIYAPGTDTRWLGSIAMNDDGAIGMCYVRSNSTTMYPSLYYTGRRACDPLGTLPITETLVAAGTFYQDSLGNDSADVRIGDYSQLTIDPTNGTTFWGTSEYFGGTTATSAARTRIFSFDIPSCFPSAGVSISSSYGSNPICEGSTVNFTASPVNGGSSPSYQWKINGGNVGTNSNTYSSSTLLNGDVVTCVMTSNLPTVINNPATSNALTMAIHKNEGNVNVQLSATSVCQGSLINLQASQAYCQPAYNFGTSAGNYISQVNLWNLTSNTGASAAPYYLPVTTTGLPSLQAGFTYTITITAGASNSSNYVAAWMDFNDDKSFDLTEKLGQSNVLTGAYPSSSFIFVVPLNVATNYASGIIRLRVRMVYGQPNITPCSTENFGETEDYNFVISGGSGTTPITNFNWISNNTNPTTGALVFSNPTYSQQYSLVSTDAYGCLSPIFTTQPIMVNSFNTQTTATPAIICNGGTSALTVGATTNYCQPSTYSGTGFGQYISNIALWDFSIPLSPVQMLSNATGASSSPYYTIYPASGNTTATLQAGNTYAFYFNGGSALDNKLSAFIDYDRNGELTQGLEKIGTASFGAYPATGGITFTIPTWAHNGATRLRLRMNDDASLGSCAISNFGETEDYTITIVGGITPAPNSYNWQPSSISGSGNSVIALPNTSTEYTVVATDAIGCSASTKISVLVENAPSYYLNYPTPQWICAGDTTMLSVIPTPVTYCQPVYSSGTGLGDFINQVLIYDINYSTLLNNTSGASANPYYTLYPQSGSTTAALAAGSSYSLTLTCGSFTSLNNIAAWIDYDGDGNWFEPVEKLGETGAINSAYGSGTIAFVIPTHAKNGTARLRVRESYSTYNLEACNSTYVYGETEDYDITITGGVAPATYNWSSASISTTGSSVFIMPTYTQTFTLTATNGYGCQQAPATIITYVNSPTVQATASASSICLGTSTTLTATSNYCQPNYTNGNTSGDFLQSVSIDGTSLNNTSGANATSYTLYNATGNTTTTLIAGNTYTLTVTVGTRIGGNTFAAWMDFDRNHELNNGFEKLAEVYNLNANATASIVFTIPAWANDGASRLRIRETFLTPGILSCNTYFEGETEDYPITITGGLYAPEPTFVWNDPLNTMSATLTTSPAYSTQYKVTATDVNGCSKTSTTDVVVNSVPALTVSASPTSICAGSSVTLMANYTSSSVYCTPQTFNGNSGGHHISLVSIQGTALNNATGALASPFYNVYPTSGSTTTTLNAGSTYTLALTTGSYCCNNNITAWLDYNQNYSFEMGIERIAAVTNISGNSTQYILFTVPAWAKNGSARLRVREAYGISNMNACTTYGQGETEDYTISIVNGVNSQPLSISWNPTTNPATGTMVLASPTATTTYTATLSDQYGCTSTATQTISMITPASFYTNTYGVCVDSVYTFYASPITCSGNAFNGNGTSYGASLSNSWAMTQTSNFTMEAWVKWNGATGSNQIICYNGNSTTNGYGLMLNSSNANKLAILCAGSTTLNSTVNLTVGVWQHVVVKRSPTLSGGFWTLYVDGISYNPSPNTGIPIAPTTGGTYVGRGTSANYFNGSIDEVRYWSSMLSNAQISANKVACISAPQSGLAGYWKFNEAIGSTSCTDMSGGNRTLTLSNAAARTVSASYAWQFGDGGIGSGITTTHLYTSSGDKNVTLTVNDITGCLANDFQTIHISHCYKSLSLKLFLQGYYLQGTQQMNSTLLNQGQNNLITQTDTITVELHDLMMPQNIADSYQGVLNTDGTMNCIFYNVPTNIMGFYIVVKHRNTIETWSNSFIMFNYMNQASYDFSTNANKAYGNNQSEVESGVWALYSGDIVIDENVDLLDIGILETDINNFQFGYYASDTNGDGNVDLLDVPVVEANVNAFIFSNHP